MKRTRIEVSPQVEEFDYSLPWKISVDGQTTSEHRFQFLAIFKAIKIGKRIEQRGGLASLLIKRPDGTIRDERTYPRSSDPKRSKG